jgi:NADH dehydrogenase FAD-containing subunit
MPKLITTRTRIADLGKPRIIVIGGGFGGLEVAKGLEGFKAQTVLFDKYNHHCFQPLPSQVATSWLETSSIVFPLRKRFKNEESFFRVCDVTPVKPEENYIGFFAWLFWMFVHLISLIGFKNKLFVLFSWIWSYLSYDKSNRLIIARPKDGVN